MQQVVGTESEAERALVAANHELIARFEKKIQATLARVWGEDAPSADDEISSNTSTGGSFKPKMPKTPCQAKNLTLAG